MADAEHQVAIQRATGLRVEMDNVANACALSEVWFGDSDGLHDLVVVNVSEGIGTGIFPMASCFAARTAWRESLAMCEMEMNGPRCGCGGRGCWETVASNRAGLRYYDEMSGASAPATFAALVKMAQSDDANAIKALGEDVSLSWPGTEDGCQSLWLRARLSSLAILRRVVLVRAEVRAELKQNAFRRRRSYVLL